MIKTSLLAQKTCEITNLMMKAVHRLDLRDIRILIIYLWMLILTRTIMMKWIYLIQIIMIVMIRILEWMIECLTYNLCIVDT